MSDQGQRLRIVDELWVALSAIDVERDRRARIAVRRRHALRVVAIVLLTLLALAAIALAARSLLFGAPAPPTEPGPTVGRFLPGTVRILSLRVPDPGGGPPWGMRVEAAAHHEQCVQAGRVVAGRLVALGVDGSFHNDGRAHVLPVTSEICGGGRRARGPLRAGGTTTITTRSATVGDPQCTTPGLAADLRFDIRTEIRLLRDPLSYDTRAVIARVRNALRLDRRRLAHLRPACPAGDLRTVVLGVLGPGAVAVTLSNRGSAPITHRLSRADRGGFLFVLRGPRVPPGARLAIRYRSGLTCPDEMLGPQPGVVISRACLKAGAP